MYARIENNLIVATSPNLTPHTDTLVPSHAKSFDAFIGGVLYPNPTNDWEVRLMYSCDGLDVNDDPIWVLDQVMFTPYFFNSLDSHLQTILESRFLYVVGSIDAYFKNDPATRQAISDYVDDKDAVNDPLYYIDFKARDVNEDPLWVTLNGSQIQGLKHSLTTRMKNAYIALKAIQAQHGNTPYTDVQSGLDDFDTQFGGL